MMMMITEADLATVSRRLGIKVRTSSAVTTFSTGARTSSQTYILGRAFDGKRVAHPIVLLKLLRSNRALS